MVMSLLTRPKKTVATVIIATDGSGDYNTDGVADDVEIQAAVDSLPATGGCIYIKEGTYNLANTILITTQNVTIVGCGRSTHIASPGITAIWITGQYSTIEKIHLVGDDTVTTYGIYILADYSIVKSCWIEDYQNGIYILGNVNNVLIIDNWCESNMWAIRNDGTFLGAYNIIANNFCFNNRWDGIRMENIYYSVIIGNMCYNNGDPPNTACGILLRECYGCDITGNSLVQNTLGGIGILATSRFINISGNYCYDNDNYGIYITADSYGCNLSGNFCNENGDVGIFIRGDRNNINGNFLYNQPIGIGIGQALPLVAGADYVNVNGNKTMNNVIGISVTGDYNSINGNNLSDTTGIEITGDTGENNNLIAGNMLQDCTTKIIDRGVNTQIFNNME